MKVLLVTNLFPPDYDGGYEMNAWKLARGLRERGVDLEVATSRFREGFAPVPEEPWVHRIFDFRFPLNVVPSGGLRNKVEILRRLIVSEGFVKGNIDALRRLVRGRDYDVAYVFGLQAVGFSVVSALSERNIPVLWHFGDHSLADRMGYWDRSATYRLAAKTFLKPVYQGETHLDLSHAAFVSRFLLDYYREHGVPLKETYVLPRGIEYELGADVDRPREDPPAILMAGRIAEAKGFHVAIKALRILHDRRPDLDWRLRIAGSGEADYLADIRELAKPLGDRVEFLGKRPREEIVAMLRRATLFVSASVWGEPFANTIIETLGAGTPLVGADSGSILEVVTPGESALVYPKHDPDALSRELERALDDPALRLSLARKGVERIVEAYTFDRILDRTERLLADVAETRADGAGV